MNSILILAVGIGIAVGIPEARAPQPHLASACYGADAYSARQIAELVSITGAMDPKGVAWRQRVSLPSVPPSAITLVSDSTVCANALTALNQVAQYDDGPATRLYLISVGAMYVASNPNFPAGEWTQQFVFDSTLTYKFSYLK
jgi:hypothetical protein